MVTKKHAMFLRDHWTPPTWLLPPGQKIERFFNRDKEQCDVFPGTSRLGESCDKKNDYNTMASPTPTDPASLAPARSEVCRARMVSYIVFNILAKTARKITAEY